MSAKALTSASGDLILASQLLDTGSRRLLQWMSERPWPFRQKSKQKQKTRLVLVGWCRWGKHHEHRRRLDARAA